ncbi:MAG: hypothetical protein ACRENP_18260, partial [Longimicrobiales bacterium]
TATGCAPGADAEHADLAVAAATVAPQQVSITTKDYFFVAPDSIESGLTTIQLTNNADELHHVQIVRLADGHSAAELEAYVKANPHGAPPTWVSWVGGPNSPMPGAESQATLELTPGNYALIC